ncbi:MAG: HPr-rel-A system PqqD family peptide chaperone [Rubrivivax sp.]|nr:HPr-rel-A system PqqD family peptide chaperone [Rubrivivax sp.]
MTDGSGRHWQAAGGGLRLRHWGHEAAVHHSRTCTTHLLDAAAGEILEALRDTPHAVDAGTLYRRLTGTDIPDDNARLMLEETLQRLAQAGLAVAIDP